MEELPLVLPSHSGEGSIQAELRVWHPWNMEEEYYKSRIFKKYMYLALSWDKICFIATK